MKIACTVLKKRRMQLLKSNVDFTKNSDFSIGYNAATGHIVDMYEAGIIDPAKVTRSALQNAASIASMILTTECIVVDKQET